MRKIKIHAVFMTMFAIFFSSCGYNYEEILRVTNASGTVDAVAIELLTGATVATPTKVYVGSKGIEIKGEPVFVAGYVDGLTIFWHGDDSFTIRAQRARVFSSVDSINLENGGGAKKYLLHWKF